MYELVKRKDGTNYLRRKVSKDFDSSSKKRQENLIQFGKLAHSAYGKEYEDMINIMQEGMKPVGRTEKPRIIEITPEQLRQIKLGMIKKGIKEIILPPGHKVVVRKKAPVKVTA